MFTATSAENVTHDGDAGVATLVAFALNCWACDAATHVGIAGFTARRETARIQLEKFKLNAVFGWWWADPIAALGVVVFLLREGRGALTTEHLDDCC